MASRKTRAKRRQERMQQLQRSAVASPAQMRIEELNALKEIHPLEEQPASLQDEWEPIPAKEVEQRIECVPLERIVTEQYQRILNMKNVAGIVKNFDPAKLGVLVVSHRADGTYAVLDGQHRLAALRRLGYDAANCIVLEGMTIRQEADYFAGRTRTSSPCASTTHSTPLCGRRMRRACASRRSWINTAFGMASPASRCASAPSGRCSASCAGLGTGRWN